MFLFTGPTPKLLNSCGANVVDLMACGHPTEHLAHKHTLRLAYTRFQRTPLHAPSAPPPTPLAHPPLFMGRDELASRIGLLRPLICYHYIFPMYQSASQPRLGLRPLSPDLFMELSSLRPQICFFSIIFIKCHSKLTKSQNGVYLRENGQKQTVVIYRVELRRFNSNLQFNCENLTLLTLTISNGVAYYFLWFSSLRI